MTAPTIIVAEVGKSYMVPCLYVPKGLLYWSRQNWIPVLGTRHKDPDLGIDRDHYHIDWRFVSAVDFDLASFGPVGMPHGKVISNNNLGLSHSLVGEPELRRKRCRRMMPTFPDLAGRESHKVFARMEASQAKRCSRLKDGHICPHRGIDLRAFSAEDGTAICPGHGLRWNLTTGEMIPRYTAGGQS